MEIDYRDIINNLDDLNRFINGKYRIFGRPDKVQNNRFHSVQDFIYRKLCPHFIKKDIEKTMSDIYEKINYTHSLTINASKDFGTFDDWICVIERSIMIDVGNIMKRNGLE